MWIKKMTVSGVENRDERLNYLLKSDCGQMQKMMVVDERKSVPMLEVREEGKGAATQGGSV